MNKNNKISNNVRAMLEDFHNKCNTHQLSNEGHAQPSIGTVSTEYGTNADESVVNQCIKLTPKLMPKWDFKALLAVRRKLKSSNINNDDHNTTDKEEHIETRSSRNEVSNNALIFAKSLKATRRERHIFVELSCELYNRESNSTSEYDVQELLDALNIWFIGHKLTAFDVLLRQYFTTCIRELVADYDPNARLQPFGSTACGTDHRESDVDLALSSPNIPHDIIGIKSYLSGLASSLIKRKKFRRVLPILNARVPIITITAFNGLVSDVAIATDFTEKKSILVQSYINIDQRVLQLVLVIKHWAKVRRINDASCGSLNSFGWTMLVLCFLQICKPAVLPNLQAQTLSEEQQMKPSFSGKETYVDTRLVPYDAEHFRSLPSERRLYIDVNLATSFRSYNTWTIEILLLHFFNFYANVFDHKQHCISIRHGHLVRAQDVNFCVGARSLLIADCFDERDNVGRSVRPMMMEIIKLEFKRAFFIISKQPSLNELFAAQVDLSKNSIASPKNPRHLLTRCA